MSGGRTLFKVITNPNNCYFLQEIGEFPINEIQLTFGITTIIPENGFVIFAPTAVEIFDEVIGNDINNRTLIKKGVTPPDDLKKSPFAVDFVPSVENIAQFLYLELFPSYLKRNVILVSVEVKGLFFESEFVDQRLKELVLGVSH
ncbi:hypothetical protein [Chengkuizengella sediminis]|uniref:hypothetical protein n=1 Tax=Chengkuizengella sediminis TaxID=1885917 RepID=UPI00138952AB|nr:hypothetical protein [Chengkuizengella sediminis]NDI36179.1 hypothetical protein [Chengkuizengella sediminis]